MCGWFSFQIEEALFAALRIPFFVAHDLLLQVMTTLHYISDSARFIALCWVMVTEAFSLHETVT